MKMQNYEIKNKAVCSAFTGKMQKEPPNPEKKLKMSWSNWGFGREKLEDSVKRLKKYGVDYIEIHGNHYGKDLGYDAVETAHILDAYGIKVSGVCGMFSRENDLSSNVPLYRQNALDYIKRELEFMCRTGGEYLLIVPGAVGRPEKYDDAEYDRSIETLRLAADLFEQYGVKGAVEPIRSAEVSFIHTFAEAKQYIADLDCAGIRYINGDIYHMQSEESHIGEAILAAGEYLCNLHLADSNRRALGMGSMDVDTVIMSLYAIGYEGYVTPEPLGPGGAPYPAMHGKNLPEALDGLVEQTVRYFRERENSIICF